MVLGSEWKGKSSVAPLPAAVSKLLLVVTGGGGYYSSIGDAALPRGSGMWHTWFDKDLSVADRVLLRKMASLYMNLSGRIRRPILRIPSLPKLSERGLATEDGKAEMDAQFAPILAIQIESELMVPYDSESSMPVEHPERIGHVYPQNRTPHHPLLIQRTVSLLDESSIHMMALFDIGEQGSDSVQGARPQIMLQAMTHITRWLAQGTKTEGVVERAVC
ncbi:unnamed protein product [Sphagnum troendelagicum]